MTKQNNPTEFLWWTGVVEERCKETKGLGRVKVRVHGYHTSKVDELPTEKLPWCVVLMPTTSACVSGVGQNHGLIESSSVFGFWLDGKVGNQGVVIGSWWGNTPPDRKNKGKGTDIKLDGGIRTTVEENPNDGFQAPPNLDRNALPKDATSIKIPDGAKSEGNDSGVQFIDKNKKNYPDEEYKKKSELNYLHTNECDKEKKITKKNPTLKDLKKKQRKDGGLLDDEFEIFPSFQKQFLCGIIEGLGGTSKNKYGGGTSEDNSSSIISTTYNDKITDYKPFNENPLATTDGGVVIYDSTNIQEIILGE